MDDFWKELKSYTSARVGIGAAGTSLKTQSLLHFRQGHAQARDAVHAELNTIFLMNEISSHLNLSSIQVHSNAIDRFTYLKNPNAGRVLDEASQHKLQNLIHSSTDLCFVIADGLSATAVNTHVLSLLQKVLENLNNAFTISPIIIAANGRVALGDEIGFILKAKVVVVLIGERPGLTTPDSLGIYITYNPQPGLTDECRNCISNIHGKGLSYDLAAAKLVYLINKSLRLKISGVQLKEDYNNTLTNFNHG